MAGRGLRSERTCGLGDGGLEAQQQRCAALAQKNAGARGKTASKRDYAGSTSMLLASLGRTAVCCDWARAGNQNKLQSLPGDAALRAWMLQCCSAVVQAWKGERTRWAVGREGDARQSGGRSRQEAADGDRTDGTRNDKALV